MINCLYFRALWRERDRLDSAEAMRIRRHLAVCQRCQAYNQQARTGGYRLKVLSTPEEKQS